MPTYDVEPRFWRDYDRLTALQQRHFDAARQKFVNGFRTRPFSFDPSLRVKRVQGTPDVWEITWAANGRATFSYGPEERPDEPHIIWRRIGTHAIFREP